MERPSINTIYDWVIVGGGIHGAHIAIRLLEHQKSNQKMIRIVDPNPSLLNNWKDQTSATKMTYLRSPSVHNLAIDSLSLKKFAGKKPQNRRGKFTQPYYRPRLDLFNHHCKVLLEKYSADSLHIREKVESVEIINNTVYLQTNKGRSLRSKKIVLALGQSDKRQIPSWVSKENLRVEHLFSPHFDWNQTKKLNTIAVIGGGISAVQAALYGASSGLKVYLVSRHPVRKFQFDSDPGWLGPKYMGNFSSEKNYQKRRQYILQSRNIGSVPPELWLKVLGQIREKNIFFHQEKISSYKEEESQCQLTLESSKELKVDQVILATGFQKIRPGGGMVSRLIEKYNLPTADCGFPVVDSSLAWHPLIYVSGALAELEIGPVAKNIAGARVAGEKIASLSG